MKLSVIIFLNANRTEIRMDAQRHHATNGNKTNLVCVLNFLPEEFCSETSRRAKWQRRILKVNAVISVYKCYWYWNKFSASILLFLFYVFQINVVEILLTVPGERRWGCGRRNCFFHVLPSHHTHIHILFYYF